jgi:hypothetical protein
MVVGCAMSWNSLLVLVLLGLGWLLVRTGE